MITRLVFAIFLHAIGGLTAAAFFLPYYKIKGWSWEGYWLIQGIVAWVMIPIVVVWLSVPDVVNVFLITMTTGFIWPYIFGAIWGFGMLTFGLTLRYLGISLGQSIALAFCAAFGTIVPFVWSGNFIQLFTTSSGWLLLLGVILSVLGIGINGYAGIMNEREISIQEKRKVIKEFALKKGMMIAIIAGLMSASFAFGLTAGLSISNISFLHGTKEIFKNNLVLVYILLGGFTTNSLYCLLFLMKKGKLNEYFLPPKKQVFINGLLASIGGILWYLQFFFYGMGNALLDKKYQFSGWTLHMAFIIIFSNLIGFFRHEWKNSTKKTLKTLFVGTLTLVISTLAIGCANFLL